MRVRACVWCDCVCAHVKADGKPPPEKAVLTEDENKRYVGISNWYTHTHTHTHTHTPQRRAGGERTLRGAEAGVAEFAELVAVLTHHAPHVAAVEQR